MIISRKYLASIICMRICSFVIGCKCNGIQSKVKKRDIFYFTSSIIVFFSVSFGELLHFNKLYHFCKNEFKTLYGRTLPSWSEKKFFFSWTKIRISFSCEFLVKNEGENWRKQRKKRCILNGKHNIQIKGRHWANGKKETQS